MRNFLPPQSQEPEIFLVEKGGNDEVEYGPDGRPIMPNAHIIEGERGRNHVKSVHLVSSHSRLINLMNKETWHRKKNNCLGNKFLDRLKCENFNKILSGECKT